MATKKDLVEAYSFSRRRLVTAFVSGAPGGREVEPTRPGRAIIGGLALAVLLVAGGAVLGILKSPSTARLDQEGLVSEKESGAVYLVLKASGSDDLELRPLVNITSALLILGPDTTSQDVPHDDIAREDVGAPIGILDAPGTPPPSSDLVQDGWTACTGAPGEDPSGIKVAVLDEPRATATPDLSFAVRTTSGRLFLLAQSFVGATRGVERAYAYPVPDDAATDRILQGLARTNRAAAVEVPDQWVTLFPAGGRLSLDTFQLGARDLKTPWPFRGDIPGGERAEVGDLLRVGTTLYLMTTEGTRKLDDFSATLFQALELPRKDPLQLFEAPQVPGGTDIPDASSLPDASWPTVVRTERQASGGLCAQLDTPGGQPGVVLATTESGSEASADGVVTEDVDATVESGAGAFVQSGGWSGEGPTSPVLLDVRGYAYPVGPGDEAINLGYGGVDPIVVPQDWIALFRPGVALTIDAARCPPTSEPDGSCG